MPTQDYLTAFDHWLSQYINAAVKAGKDLAFCDRRFNSALKLDDDGAAWDYVFLDPGAQPPPGRAWSVYRLHGVQPQPAAGPDSDQAPPQRVVSLQQHRERNLMGRLTAALFGEARPQPQRRRAHLRLVG